MQSLGELQDDVEDPIVKGWDAARHLLSLVFEDSPCEDKGSESRRVGFKLFLGGDLVATNMALLQDHRISHIVNCTQGFDNQFEGQGFHYFRVPILDVKGADLVTHIPNAVAFIHKARADGGNVLVHCMWGMSRAPSVAIAYLMRHEGMSLARALTSAILARKVVRPNPGFIRQLLDWEAQCAAASAPLDSAGEPSAHAGGSLDLEAYKAAYQLSSAKHAPSQSQGASPDPISLLSSLSLVSQAHFDHPDHPDDPSPTAHQRAPESSAACGQAAGGAPATAARRWRPAVCGGRLLRVATLSKDPRMAQVEGFLTAEEAAAVVALARRRGLARSRVPGGPAPGRTSTSCAVERAEPVVAALLERACALTGLRPELSEPVQVIRYEPGQEYMLHNDWFHPDSPGFTDKIAARGQRTVSVLVYLSECAGGGCTAFPVVDVRVRPRTGRAVIWWNLDQLGQPDDRVLHCGEPVEEGHEKWAMNIWFRQRPQPPPPTAPPPPPPPQGTTTAEGTGTAAP